MSDTIARHSRTNEPDLFHQLYQQGIRELAQLTGKIWTDYNIHDPGITILEQVCYALTDLVYRSDFEVADFLCQPNGTINYEQQGLARPEAILPALPHRNDEFESYFCRKFPQLERCQFVADPNVSGVYYLRCQLKLSHRQDCIEHPEHKIQLEHELQRCYQSMRPLGEDLSQIFIVADEGVKLIADIDIENDQIPEPLVAKIYFCVAHWLSRQHTAHLSISGLTDTLLAIDGIRHIHSLELCGLEDSRDLEHTSKSRNICLMLPQSSDDIQLTLRAQGHPLRLDLMDILFSYQQLQAQHEPPISAVTSALPQGHFYQLEHYESLQTLFPSNYGLQGFHFDKEQQQAQRHQLRSYLLLFDQLLANFCSDLANLRELLSCSLANPHSYQVQPLTEVQFHHIDQHYSCDSIEHLGQLREHFDNYPERKGRVFDYLLALYGEQFPDAFHQQFNGYFNADELAWQLLRYKQQFILQISELTQNRAQGPDLSDSHDIGGYQHRLRLLLGLAPLPQLFYSRNITQHLLNIVSDESFSCTDAGKKALFHLRDSLASQRFDLPRCNHDLNLTPSRVRTIRHAILALQGQKMPITLLQSGMHHHGYQIFRRSSDSDYQLFFHLPKLKQWLYIGHHSDYEQLVQFSHYLQQWIIELNYHTEGLYAVEHIALRPRQSEPRPFTADPYTAQLSMILPGFTARHCSEHFRQEAEQLIKANTPAHLYVHFHWLSFYAFCAFETLYLQWRESRANEQSSKDIEHTDAIAAELLAFLQQPPSEHEELIL